MVVTVRLHTVLRRQTPQGIVDRLTLDLADGATVATVLDHLGIRGQGDLILLVLNGRPVSPEQALADGDDLRLVPAISGG
jgi:sulfur carrier protein ThiS